LAAMTERHKMDIMAPGLTPCTDFQQPFGSDPDLKGAVIVLELGWPGSTALRFASRVLKSGRHVWLYLPRESAVEVLDRERLSSYWRHWGVITAVRQAWRVGQALRPIGFSPDMSPWYAARCLDALALFKERARPIPLPDGPPPTPEHPLE